MDINALIQNSLSAHHNRIAVVDQNGQYTYKALDEELSKVAFMLKQAGVEKGSVVPVLMDNGFGFISSILGIMKHGCFYLPLDPNYPNERLKYMVEDSGARLLVTDRKYKAVANNLLDEIIIVESVVEVNKVPWEESEHAYMIYTSGTTGKPKGVIIQSAALGMFVLSQSERFGVIRESKFVQMSSVCFDMSVWEMFLSLCNGATLYVPARSVVRDGMLFADYLEMYGVTHMLTTPSMLSMLPVQRNYKFNAIVSAGEKCSQHLVDKWGRYPFFDAYGATECTIYSTVGQRFIGDQVAHVGCAIDGAELLIFDEGFAHVLPCGSTGHIVIAGEGVALGYHNRSDLNAQKFFERDGRRHYVTGDVGFINENGNLVFCGRSDRQVKVNGYRIELEEIESVTNLIPGVDMSYAELKDMRDAKSLVLYVSPKKLEDRRDHIKQVLSTKLPKHMLPNMIRFVEKFPVTGSGKVDGKKLSSLVS